MGGHAQAGGEPGLCSPVTPFVVVGDVGVDVEDGGEVLDCFAGCGGYALAAGIAEDGVLFAVAVDTGFED